MNRCLILFFLFFCSQTSAQNSWDPKVEKTKPKLPQFTASIDTLVCNNQALKGKTVYINFWYAACSPCIAELDALNTMYKKLEGTKNFEFISFTSDSSNVIEMLIDKYKIKYPVFFMPKDDLKKMNQGKGFPSSMVVDTYGNIVFTKLGGNSDKKEARKIIMGEIYPAILKILSIAK